MTFWHINIKCLRPSMNNRYPFYFEVNITITNTITNTISDIYSVVKQMQDTSLLKSNKYILQQKL
jgi:hypothetical protein